MLRSPEVTEAALLAGGVDKGPASSLLDGREIAQEIMKLITVPTETANYN